MVEGTEWSHPTVPEVCPWKEEGDQTVLRSGPEGGLVDRPEVPGGPEYRSNRYGRRTRRRVWFGTRGTLDDEECVVRRGGKEYGKEVDLIRRNGRGEGSEKKGRKCGTSTKEALRVGPRHSILM